MRRKKSTFAGAVRGQNLEVEGLVGVEVIGDRVKATRCTNIRIVGDNAEAKRCTNVTVIGRTPTLLECKGVVLTTTSEGVLLTDAPVGGKRRSATHNAHIKKSKH